MARLHRFRVVITVCVCLVASSAGSAGGGAATALAAAIGVPAGSLSRAGGAGAGLLACTAPSTQRVSVSSGGSQGNADSGGLFYTSAISADGRYVAFSSSASNLVPGDTNGSDDVFVHDRVAGTTELVSASSSGAVGNGASVGGVSISADGRYIAFSSSASNLVPGDTNGSDDVFVHDRVAGTTELVSVSSSGIAGNGASFLPSVSADGRFVAFASRAINLVPGDTNGYADVFVHDRLRGTTERVSVTSSGGQALGDSYYGDSVLPSISADGRYVAFISQAWNLAPVYDHNGHAYVHDRVTGTTELIDLDVDGTSHFSWGTYSVSISADGRYVAFSSADTDLVPGGDGNGSDPDVYVRDRVAGQTARINQSRTGAQANNSSELATISADGRYVGFTSLATNLAPGGNGGGWHAYLKDRSTGAVDLVDVATDGAAGNDSGFLSAISADGRYVAFSSDATNLVPGDNNSAVDMFVRDRGVQTGVCGSAAIAALTWHSVQTGSNAGYGFAAVTGAGRQVCFGLTWSNNLGTPTGADLDLATAPGIAAVPLFTGSPGPHTSGRAAWGCASATATVAADIARHPDRYLVTVRTAQYPAGAIAGRLQT